MKQLTKMMNGYKSLLALFVLTFFQVTAWAQDKKVDVDLNVDKDGGGDWYTQPWVWIIGGAVFILLLVALMRSGKKD